MEGKKPNEPVCKFCNSEMDLMEEEPTSQTWVCMNEECGASVTFDDQYIDEPNWEQGDLNEYGTKTPEHSCKGCDNRNQNGHIIEVKYCHHCDGKPKQLNSAQE